jgi:hypothetical protein
VSRAPHLRVVGGTDTELHGRPVAVPVGALAALDCIGRRRGHPPLETSAHRPTMAPANARDAPSVAGPDAPAAVGGLHPAAGASLASTRRGDLP